MTALLDRAWLLGSKGRAVAARPLDRRPTVSVVIPCYNYGHFLRGCVGSLMDSGDDVSLEIVIVDDRSTDDSLAVARAIATENPAVSVIAHPVNKGHIATYNDGLAAASGEFVQLLSADDLATPGALARAAAVLAAEPGVGMVYGNVVTFEGEPGPCRTAGGAHVVWKGRDWLRRRCRSGYNVIASPEVMMRTSVLRSFGGYKPDLPHAGDFEMWLRTAAVSDVAFILGADQAFYRQHAVNMNKRLFLSGTSNGQLIDLKQRWLCFESVFADVGARVEDAPSLLATARRTLAAQAFAMANYAYARGFRDYPYEAFEAFAREIHPAVEDLAAYRSFRRRRQLGFAPLPLHPLWAPAAVAWRLTELARRSRRRHIGV